MLRRPLPSSMLRSKVYTVDVLHHHLPDTGSSSIMKPSRRKPRRKKRFGKKSNECRKKNVINALRRQIASLQRHIKLLNDRARASPRINEPPHPKKLFHKPHVMSYFEEDMSDGNSTCSTLSSSSLSSCEVFLHPLLGMLERDETFYSEVHTFFLKISWDLDFPRILSHLNNLFPPKTLGVRLGLTKRKEVIVLNFIREESSNALLEGEREGKFKIG